MTHPVEKHRDGTIAEGASGSTYFADRKLLGILLALACYGMYSLHYATMKWLGTGYSLWQLTFIRSVLMLAITLALGGRGAIRGTWESPYKLSTALRGVLQFASMACFFIAAHSMSLAEVTTIYSAAPLIIVVVSIFLLGEKVRGYRWIAVGLGLVGTVVAADPGSQVSVAPAIFALGSGFFWALTVVFTRKSGARESSTVQLVTTGVVFVTLSGALMTWKTPITLFDWALMPVLGLQIYLAQFLFFEACRFAPASLVGPLEYSGVVWSCILGYLIFADIPTAHVILGALLVIGGGIALVNGTLGESHAMS